MRKKLTVLCAAVLLAMLLTISASAAAPHFEDVSADTPYAESILYLADHGITNGTDSRLFSPNAPVTTRQWAVLLCQAYGVGGRWYDVGRTGPKRCQAGVSKRVDGGNSTLRSDADVPRRILQERLCCCWHNGL